MLDEIKENIDLLKIQYNNGIDVTFIEILNILSDLLEVVSIKNEYVYKLITLRKLIKNSKLSSSVFNKDLILVDNIIIDILEKNDIDENRLEDINKIYSKYKIKK